MSTVVIYYCKLLLQVITAMATRQQNGQLNKTNKKNDRKRERESRVIRSQQDCN